MDSNSNEYKYCEHDFNECPLSYFCTQSLQLNRKLCCSSKPICPIETGLKETKRFVLIY